MLEQEGFPRLLFVGDVVPSPIAGFGTSLDRVNKHAGEVQRMVRAALRAIQFAKTNRRDTVAAIAKWTGMDAKLADGSYDMAAPTWAANGVPGPETLRAAMEEVQRELKLDRAPDPAQAFDWSFVKP
jgi:ABC-type nitrate/sulfonate/bicarbonate transport system substrate-binding protein